MKIFLLAVTLMFAAVSTNLMGSSDDLKPRIEITYAEYYVSWLWGKCDTAITTANVKKLCNNQESCEFKVDNEVGCNNNDPWEGKKKTLWVQYKCKFPGRGEIQQRDIIQDEFVHSHSNMKLECDIGKKPKGLPLT